MAGVLIQANLLSKHLEGRTKIYTSNQKYLLSVLVDIVYMSWGLSEVYSLTRSVY